MNVFVLGLDGATWDILRPLAEAGELPHLARLMAGGAAGTLASIFPPLSPVAWTGVMTGKNSGKHGIFEFLEYEHDPLGGRVNSSRAIKAELVWEIAGRHGKATVAGGVPMSYPPRRAPGFYLGDFLSPPGAPDFASDPAILADLERALGEPYRPWNTSVHDGGREAEALAELTEYLEHHLKAVRFLMGRCPWDLFMFDLMATDRAQHELWHAWDPDHRLARGRDLSAVRAGFVGFWKRLDAGIGEIEAALPPGTALVLMSDHGFGPIEWYVNFNVWLLERGSSRCTTRCTSAEALVLPPGGDPGVVLQPDGAAGPGQPEGRPVPGQADGLARTAWASRRSCRAGTSTGRAPAPTRRATSARSSSTRRAGSRRAASRRRTSARCWRT
jgi:predicted AlkP superfamily phosphohydrolase/phosphomutase